MTRRSSLRASDADRDRVAERLRQAATEGRLLAHEFEERLGRALRALTYGELDALVADLPRSATSGASTRAVRPARGRRRGRGRLRGDVFELEPRRSVALALARRHPLAVAILSVTIGLSIAAAALTALAILASGVWLVPLILLLVLRHRARSLPLTGGRHRAWG